MKKTFFSTISLALVFSMALSFASCDGDDDVTKENTSTTTEATQTASPQATEKQTEKATDAQTDTPDESEPIEDSTTNAIVTEVTVTDAPETKQPQIIVQTTKAPETSEPIEDTTKTPETEAPVEDTTSPATTAPGQDPNVDYSKWGYYGFEALLPAPLPFNDTQWLSRRYAGNSYDIMSDKPFKISAEKENIKTLENYVKSLEAFGYTYLEEDYSYLIYDEMGSTFEFSYVDDYVCVSFILVV